MSRLKITVVISLCLIIHRTGYGQVEQDVTQPLVLENITLINGYGDVPRPNTTLVVAGNQIVDLFEVGSKSLPDSAIIMNLAGHYVIPGLIDAHVHLATDPSGRDNRTAVEARLRQALHDGITSVRDMGGDARALSSLARDALLGEIESPNIYYSAIMAGSSFFADPRTKTSARGTESGAVPWLRSVDPDTDLRIAVAEAKGSGATGIKIYANLDSTMLRRISQEAHRQGMEVWAHSTVFPSRPSDAVSAGIDVLSHVAYLVFEGSEEAPNSYLYRKQGDYTSLAPADSSITRLLTTMREQGTILDPTLQTISSQNSNGWVYEVIATAHELGVVITTGTDLAKMPVHDELALLVEECGLSPLAALTTATHNGAKAIGIEKTHGTIEVGKMADMVVLRADPSRDIANTREIAYVLKAGKVYAQE